MARLSAETVTLLARDLYDCTLSERGADQIAHMVGAMHRYIGHLSKLDLSGTQPPFGYAVLVAEANRLRKTTKAG